MLVGLATEANSSIKIGEIDPTVAPNIFVSLTLSSNNAGRIADNFYALSSRHDIYDYANNDWYMTPISQYADFKALASMPTVELEITKLDRPGNEDLTFEVKNPSAGFALFTTLKLKNRETGQLLPDVYWSDNYFSLAPGESRRVTVDIHDTGLSPDQMILTVGGWNVAPQN
jgi:exo-1,4-beta-D-glucosaminidase